MGHGRLRHRGRLPPQNRGLAGGGLLRRYDAGEYDSATRAFFDDVYGWYESYYGTSAGTVVPSEPGRDFGYYPEPENDFVFAVVGRWGCFC